MDLTDENKKHIDGLNIYELLQGVRFAPIGDKWHQGETGEHWQKRLAELRAAPGGQEEYVAASKSIGW